MNRKDLWKEDLCKTGLVTGPGGFEISSKGVFIQNIPTDRAELTLLRESLSAIWVKAEKWDSICENEKFPNVAKDMFLDEEVPFCIRYLWSPESGGRIQIKLSQAIEYGRGPQFKLDNANDFDFLADILEDALEISESLVEEEIKIKEKLV